MAKCCNFNRTYIEVVALGRGASHLLYVLRSTLLGVICDCDGAAPVRSSTKYIGHRAATA